MWTYQSPPPELPELPLLLVLVDEEELLAPVAVVLPEQKLPNQLWMLERPLASSVHAESQTPAVAVLNG